MPSFKERAAQFIGYDKATTEAASTTHYLKSFTDDLPAKSVDYVKRLFPFVHWIGNYNLKWAAGDLIAGFTVGLVLIPQSMSYAKIAGLAPEYGIYSSFVGVVVYAFFATSKDITVGPVAVMSLLVSQVISYVQSQPGGELYSAPVIATALAFICGFIILGIGLLRLGWLVEFIPAPAVSGFMTGSAISIAAGQVASLMGYSSKFNTRDATYRVIINSFKYLGSTKKDAAYGLSGLVFLYTVRAILSRVAERARNPVVKRIAFFANTFRTAFVVIFLTLFSYIHLRNISPADYDISILGTVPAGFQHMGRPLINANLLSLLAPQIPVATIVLLLEHIAIAKSFGRVNNYKIDPNQELIAIGVTNTVGTLFGAYPATGSFSRTAIKSKAGVRTPLGGWVTAVVVIVALYALTGAFYWIPNAGLSAVIIHAVGDLIASPRQVYSFWKISPLEAIIWFAAVIVTIFSSIENGIYTSVALSAALLLYRIAKPRGYFLGRVRLHPEEDTNEAPLSIRDIYIPLQPDGVHNAKIIVEAPPPGVIIYRFDEAFIYPNASYYFDIILDYAKEHTRSGQDFTHISAGDRPWNDPGPSRWSKPEVKVEGQLSGAETEALKPLLRAIVLDFSGVSNLDTTSVQNLVDLRRVVERYANAEVEFHFANLLSPWIKRALIAGGFGTGAAHERRFEVAPVVPSGADLVPHPNDFNRRQALSPAPSPPNGPESDLGDIKELDSGNPKALSWSGDFEKGPVIDDTFSRFHVDIQSAVAAVGRRGD